MSSSNRPILGISLVPARPQASVALPSTGAKVSSVVPGGLADVTGIEQGDIILSFGSVTDIPSMPHTRALADIKSATVHSAPIVILRSGITVRLSLGVAPSPPQQEPEKPSSERVRELLFSPEIDVAALRSLVFGGCPSETVLRSTLWRVLLGYLPLQRNQWSRHVTHKRQQYTDFCAEFIVDPDTLADNEDDDPLGASAGDQGSKYSDYFKNKELMLEIDKDTKRTWTSMHFFATPDESQQHCKQGAGPSSQQGSHQQCIARVLFVFARLNPGIRYVQGMNELLAPIYYVFATCEDPDNRKAEGGLFARDHSEADSFWCFCNLMADLRDNFCMSLDHTTTGVGGTLLRLEDLLRAHDAALHQHLVEELGLVPQMFALRWITVLFSQEFHLPDVLTLWDAILCQKDRLDFSLHVCLAMLDMIRPSLIHADFSAAMRILQNYPVSDVVKLAYAARRLQVTVPAPVAVVAGGGAVAVPKKKGLGGGGGKR